MGISWMLDTNICIYIARHRPPEVLERFNTLEVGQVGMSVITYGELHNGAMKSQQQALALQKLRSLAELIPALPMEMEVAEHYGDIRSHLERSGTPIGNNDLWIAAHARQLGVTLVTNNTREFVRVPGLQVENWVAG